MTEQTKRQLYQGGYRSEDTLDDAPTPHDGEVSTTGSDDPTNETPEEKTWKKRYSDLRSFSDTKDKRIKELEVQLRDAQKSEIKIPSSKEELEDFSRRYPDLYRAMRSVAMTELLQQKEDIKAETERLKEKLEATERDLGLKKILNAHPDFEELNMSQAFHDWAAEQPKQIQDWLFESTDPVLCIKALDIYKAEQSAKKAVKRREPGADSNVRTRTAPEISNGQKRTWKESEVAKLKPREFAQLEAQIEAARAEGRFEYGV